MQYEHRRGKCTPSADSCPRDPATEHQANQMFAVFFLVDTRKTDYKVQRS